jgi:hypothetical protein
VHLGQLPADHRRPVGAVRRAELAQGDVQAAGRLEEDLGAGVGGQFREARLALAWLARREALEAEPVRRQPRDSQGGRQRRGAGNRGDPQPGLGRGRHDPVAGVADAWHPGVGHHEHVLAVLQLLDELLRAACLDDVVVGDHPPADPHVQFRGEAAHPAGVLGRHHVGAGELSGQPGRGILRAADRDAGEDQRALSPIARSRAFGAMTCPHAASLHVPLPSFDCVR